MIPANPLGLTITYFRQDQAFTTQAMIANAIFAASILTLDLLFFFASELRSLVPYRYLLVHHYGSSILLYSAVLFANLTAVLFANLTEVLFTLGRRFFLKDTGRKLAHFDRELNAGRTPMPPHVHREELQ